MDLIHTAIDHGIGYIILNRPEKRNALSSELVEELKRSFRKFEGDNKVKVVVLKATGKAFCAGADLAYIQQLSENTYEENLEDSNRLKELFEIIHDLDKVVIAQVQGHALAGGCGLASICDFVFSVPEARFGYTEVKIGFVPALVSVFLTAKIGETLAREMLLSGRLYTAEEVLSFRLINKIVPAEDLAEEVKNFAFELIENNSKEAMKLTKSLFTINQGLGFREALDEMAKMNAKARATEDCKKGISAFLNKENISWK